MSHKIFEKTGKEKLILKQSKKQYKDGMRKLLGDNWKTLSRKHTVYNVPDKKHIVEQIRKEVLC